MQSVGYSEATAARLSGRRRVIIELTTTLLTVGLSVAYTARDCRLIANFEDYGGQFCTDNCLSHIPVSSSRRLVPSSKRVCNCA